MTSIEATHRHDDDNNMSPMRKKNITTAAVSCVTENETNNVSTADSKCISSEYETEDEEVCANCYRGGRFRGWNDDNDEYDFDDDDDAVHSTPTDNSDTYDEEDDDDTDNESLGENGFRITCFVKNPFLCKIPLICPKPKVAPPPPPQRHTYDKEPGEETKDMRREEIVNKTVPNCHSRQRDDTCNLTEAETEERVVDVMDNGNSFSHIPFDRRSDCLDFSGGSIARFQNDPQYCSDDEFSDIVTSIEEALELVLDESSVCDTTMRPCLIGVMKDEIDTSSSDSAQATKRPFIHTNHVDSLYAAIGSACKKARTITHDDLTSMYSKPCPKGTSVVFLSSDDNDDKDLYLDQQLSEELGEGGDQHSIDHHYHQNEESPVPLLTPPGSPLTVEWEGISTTICEWPSNLIVDNAMQAVNELYPMSPTSLENLERVEYDRVNGTSIMGNEFIVAPLCYMNNSSNATNSFLSPFLNGVIA